MKAVEALDKLMERVTPLLEKISMAFGSKFTLTLIAQVEGKPGCLILSPSNQEISQLIKSLQEAEKLTAEAEAPHEST